MEKQFECPEVSLDQARPRCKKVKGLVQLNRHSAEQEDSGALPLQKEVSSTVY